jgi:Fe2+ or Zn2+ uptake regulation protein
MGEISAVHLADGTTRYDPKLGPDHHHLLCEGCGLTFDVEPVGVEGLSLPQRRAARCRRSAVLGDEPG